MLILFIFSQRPKKALFEGAFPMPILCFLLVFVMFYVQKRIPKRSLKKLSKRSSKVFSADPDGQKKNFVILTEFLKKRFFREPPNPGLERSGEINLENVMV